MISNLENAREPSRRRVAVIGVCVGLVVLIWAAFGQATRFGFVNYDDDVYVYNNPNVAGGITGSGVKWAFTHVHSSNWHPLTWLSHMLDAQFYGLNAGGHHLTNLLIHTATSLLLFLLLRQMTGFLWRSAFVAVIFAIHPLRTESVVWIAERKDVLSGLFFVLTIAVYVWYARRAWSIGRYLLVALMLLLALLCKPMVVTLPFILLLLDYWPLRRFTLAEGQLIPWRCIVEKIPLLALSAAVCAITILAQHEAMSPLPLSLRLANAAVSCVVYVWQMIYPAGLVVLYPFPENGLPRWEILGAFFVLAAISIGGFVGRRKRPWLLFGWLWYLGMLVPVIGVLQVGAQAHADRYTYLPQIGLYIAIAWTVGELSARWHRNQLVPGSIFMAIVGLLTISARNQTGYWQSSQVLWTRALAFTADNIVAQNNLGNALLDDGKVDEAIVHFKEARRIKPEDAKAAFNLGNALIQQGHLTEGINDLSEAVQLKPDYAEAHINLGSVLLKSSRVSEAIEHLQKALQMEPDQAVAWNDLGYAQLQQGAVDAAATCFQKAMQIDPSQPTTQNNLGNVLMQKGQADQAIPYYRKALQLKPVYSEAEYNLGTALAQKNNLDEAIAHFARALQLKPDYASAAYNIGVARFHQDRVSEAADFFQRALKINPNYAEAHYNLGNAFVRLGKIDEAIVQFRKALEIEPHQVATRNNLGFILLQNGNVDEAVEQFKTVLQTAPENVEARFNLGNAFLKKGKVEEATDQFEKALEREPDFAEAHYGLGTALLQKRRETEALAQFQQAVRLKPDYSEALNDLAWELATAPQSSARDGNKAVELALKAEQLTGSNDLDVIDTVAAAYAEAHRFADAVQAAKRAIGFARSSGQESRVAQLSSELELYQAGQPFHRAEQN